MTMQTVVITPRAAPVVPLRVVKQHLRIDECDGSQDVAINGMIETATTLIDGPDGWLGRALAPQVLELRAPWFPCARHMEWGHAGWGFSACDLAAVSGYDGYLLDIGRAARNLVPLMCPPIADVVSISYRDPTGAAQVLDPSGYRLFDDVVLPVYGTDWPLVLEGPGAVAIRYAAGYGTAGVTPNLPANVTSAILLMTASLYENRESGADTIYGTVEKVLQPLRRYV